MSHTCFAHLRLRLAHAIEQALPRLSGCTEAPGTQGGRARRQSQATHDSCVCFETKGLFTWSGGPRSSGVGFFCFHALGDTKQQKPTPPDQGPPLHVNMVKKTREDSGIKLSLRAPYSCIFYLKFILQISVQRILMNFAQTFCSTASTMKLLFSISLVSVCLFLVTARFVHFIHRQEIVEDLNARDDPAVTGLFDMPSRSSSKIHIASCRHFGMLCTHDYQCCSHHCGFPSCLW